MKFCARFLGAVFLSGVVCCATSGCTPALVHVKAYPDSSLPISSVALLKPAAGIYVKEVDGKPMELIQNSWKSTDFEIEFIPGQHFLRVGFYNGANYSNWTVLVRADMQAGRRYLLKPNSTHHVFKAGTWAPEVVDVTEKPECWTVLAGAMGGPKGC